MLVHRHDLVWMSWSINFGEVVGDRISDNGHDDEPAAITYGDLPLALRCLCEVLSVERDLNDKITPQKLIASYLPLYKGSSILASFIEGSELILRVSRLHLRRLDYNKHPVASCIP